MVRITFDPAKRATTLQERGLDFADAAEVFAGVTGTIEDTRFDYGEDRFTTAGFLNGRFVIVVWTPRGNTRHIISMSPKPRGGLRLGQGHAKERRRWQL